MLCQSWVENVHYSVLTSIDSSIHSSSAAIVLLSSGYHTLSYTTFYAVTFALKFQASPATIPPRKWCWGWMSKACSMKDLKAKIVPQMWTIVKRADRWVLVRYGMLEEIQIQRTKCDYYGCQCMFACICELFVRSVKYLVVLYDRKGVTANIFVHFC